MQSIKVTYDNIAKLYASYMPFVNQGGVFVRTTTVFEIGTLIMLTVLLPQDTASYVVEGEVVWITPKGAQNNRPQGMGIQFKGNDARALVSKIEASLGGLLKSTQLTDTL